MNFRYNFEPNYMIFNAAQPRPVADILYWNYSILAHITIPISIPITITISIPIPIIVSIVPRKKKHSRRDFGA